MATIKVSSTPSDTPGSVADSFGPVGDSTAIAASTFGSVAGSSGGIGGN